jgi:hypothetical protein
MLQGNRKDRRSRGMGVGYWDRPALRVSCLLVARYPAIAGLFGARDSGHRRPSLGYDGMACRCCGSRSNHIDPTIPTILLHLGVLAAAAGAAGVLARTLVILFLTLGNPPGQRTVAIGIGTQDIMCLIVGLLLYAFAFVMKESRRIADENESFV